MKNIIWSDNWQQKEMTINHYLSDITLSDTCYPKKSCLKWQCDLTITKSDITSLKWLAHDQSHQPMSIVCWFLLAMSLVNHGLGLLLLITISVLFFCHPTSNLLPHIRHIKVWRHLKFNLGSKYAIWNQSNSSTYLICG